jgi:hypothetical protein
MLLSSVNKIGLDTSGMILGRSLIYKKKIKVPRMEPCGTPCVTGSHSEEYFLES